MWKKCIIEKLPFLKLCFLLNVFSRVSASELYGGKDVSKKLIVEKVNYREATVPKLCFHLNVFSRVSAPELYRGKEVSKKLIVQKVYYREATGPKDVVLLLVSPFGINLQLHH